MAMLAGNHQRSWLWGRNVVLETLAAGRWVPLELRLSDRLSSDKQTAAREMADALRVPTTVEPPARLTQLCKSDEHQGYLARMPEFPYDDAASLLAARSAAPLYLALDRIHDPFNFGSMLRSAEVLGVDAVFVGERGQAEVTSHVARGSSGAINTVRLARVPDLTELLRTMKSVGLHVVGATEKAEAPPDRVDFRRPTTLVLGNEGTGLSSETLAALDATVRIPQSGRINSLNAAVAAGILLYEAHRQRAAAQPNA